MMNVPSPPELYASNQDTVLRGGGGDNLLVGGDGNDLLVGGKGRDILIGGFGSDRLQAGAGEDILIAARTNYDHNGLALRSVLMEWASNHDYLTRVHDLMNYQGMDGLNGAFFLNVSTVQDDTSVDNLHGGAGRDWFFADTTGQTGPKDHVDDAHANEVVTNI